MIDGGAQISVRSCRLHMLRLRRHRGNVPITSGHLVLRTRTRARATVAAVVADTVDRRRIVDHCGVVNVTNVCDVYVVNGLVIVKAPIVPASAVVAFPEVAVAIIDPAIETDVWSPIAIMENVTVAVPCPIARGPQIADFRRFHPGAGNPIIVLVVVIIGPVTRHPDVTFSRT